jgi:hypothetical protein
MRPICVIAISFGGLAMGYWLLFVLFILGLGFEIHPSGVVDGTFKLGYFLSLYLPPLIFAFSIWFSIWIARRPRKKSYAED